MRNYETLILLPPELEGEALDARVAQIRAAIEAAGGTQVRDNRLGRKRLAYPVGKKEAGVYVAFAYTSETSVPEKIRQFLALDEGVLRASTVEKAAPQPAGTL